MSSPDPGAAPRTSLGVVFLVLFVDLVTFGMVFPLYAGMLDWYLAHDHGLLAAAMRLVDGLLPTAQAHATQRAALFGGLLAAAYAGLQYIASPIWGRVSDRLGRRPVLLISLVGTLLANLIWVVAGDFNAFLVSRLLAGMMTGNVGVANAAVSDLTTPETRGRGLAAIGMAFGFGFVIGPALGGLSTLLVLDTPALRVWGFHPFSGPAAVATLLAALNLVWALARFRETLPPERRVGMASVARTLDPRQVFSRALGPGVAGINLACFLHTLLFSAVEATLVFLTLEVFRFGPRDNGWLFVFMGVVSLLANGLVFRRLVGRIGPRPLVLGGFLVLLPGYLLVGLVDWHPALILLILGTGILSLGTGQVFPGLNTMASLAADPLRQGWVMGTFRSAASLGRALGPFLGAWIYFLWRPGMPYLLAAAGTILPLWLVFRFHPPGGRGEG